MQRGPLTNRPAARAARAAGHPGLGDQTPWPAVPLFVVPAGCGCLARLAGLWWQQLGRWHLRRQREQLRQRRDVRRRRLRGNSSLTNLFVLLLPQLFSKTYAAAARQYKDGVFLEIMGDESKATRQMMINWCALAASFQTHGSCR